MRRHGLCLTVSREQRGISAGYTSQTHSDWNGDAFYYVTVFAYLQRHSMPYGYQSAAMVRIPAVDSDVNLREKRQEWGLTSLLESTVYEFRNVLAFWRSHKIRIYGNLRFMNLQFMNFGIESVWEDNYYFFVKMFLAAKFG